MKRRGKYFYYNFFTFYLFFKPTETRVVLPSLFHPAAVRIVQIVAVLAAVTQPAVILTIQLRRR